MIREKLENNIYIKHSVETWQDAIRQSAQPLLSEGKITSAYVDAMIQNVIDNGTYIIIIPGFAMPHARPEYGAIEAGMALLKLEEPVLFPGDEAVKLLIALSAKDADEHSDVIAELAEVLMDDEKMKQFHSLYKPITHLRQI